MRISIKFKRSGVVQGRDKRAWHFNPSFTVHETYIEKVSRKRV